MTLVGMTSVEGQIARMDLAQHRKVYGTLDSFAVAPFVDRYGDPLSHEGRRLARLLDKARHEMLTITQDIRFELVQFLCAGLHGRRYDLALHRQRLVVLLDRYGRKSR